MKTKAKGKVWDALLPSGKGGYSWTLETIDLDPVYMITSGGPNAGCYDTVELAIVACVKAAHYFGLEIVERETCRDRNASDENES